MKRYWAVICLSFFIVSQAFSIYLTENAKFYLLTCSPGKQVYSKFGHTALYVQDQENQIDLVFNYGIFSFDEDYFLYNFIKGNTYYMLGVDYFDDFYASYHSRSIAVYAQELNLRHQEKERLFNALIQNSLPQNRQYLYNFFFDNCATRPRDIIANTLDGAVFYPQHSEELSFRNLVEMYVGKYTWLKFGIDLLLGAPADRLATDAEKMFLPDFLKEAYQHSFVERNGERTPLVKSETYVLPDTSIKRMEIPYPLIVSCFILLLAIFVSVKDIKKKKISYWFDYPILFIIGLSALLVVFVSFFSIHPTVFPNYNIFWIHPLYLLLMFSLKKSINTSYVSFLLKCNVAMLFLALFSALFLQTFNLAFYPLIFTLLIRHFVFLINGNKNKISSSH